MRLGIESVEADGLPILGDSSVQIALLLQHRPEIVVCEVSIRLQADVFTKLRYRFIQITFLRQRKSKRTAFAYILRKA